MKRVLPILFLSLLVTAACQPTVTTRGNLVDMDEAAMLSIGKSSKEDVRSILGSPTSTAAMNDNRWYYIGQNTSRFGFQAEKVTERRIVALTFDEQGILSEVTPLENSGREVAMNKDITPTTGHNLTVLQQAFGNLGRFNETKKDTSIVGAEGLPGGGGAND